MVTFLSPLLFIFWVLLTAFYGVQNFENSLWDSFHFILTVSVSNLDFLNFWYANFVEGFFIKGMTSKYFRWCILSYHGGRLTCGTVLNSINVFFIHC